MAVTKDVDEQASVYRPTPTQAENDRAAVGDTNLVKQPDGSGEQIWTPPDEKLIKAKLLLLALALSPNPPT